MDSTFAIWTWDLADPVTPSSVLWLRDRYGKSVISGLSAVMPYTDLTFAIRTWDLADPVAPRSVQCLLAACCGSPLTFVN